MEKKTTKIKSCMLCSKEINLNKDNYVKLTDYFKGEQFSEGFFHNKCYIDKLKGGDTMKNMAMSLMGKANKLLNKVGGDGDDEKEEYVLT